MNKQCLTVVQVVSGIVAFIYLFRFLFMTKLLVEALKLLDLLFSLESVSMVTVWLQL